ncbi:MAG: hypothetical protein GY715_08280 [Planctomycetes bacterium]|nr:hypothetical protein [Planctomycetota bacterium]
MRPLAIFMSTVLLARGVGAMAAQDAPLPEPPDETTEPASTEDPNAAEGEGGAAGSNPLASVNKLDLLWTLLGSGDTDTHDLSAEGAFMLHPKLKLNYEVHYFATDVTGSSENDWESIRIKPIYFPADLTLNDEWTMRVAVGAEYIHSFDNVDEGIGIDSDIAAPLFGLAFAKPSESLTLIPLVQHFLSFDGTSVNSTAFRLIGIKSLPDGFWLKLDAKILADWHHDKTPIDGEFEFGKMLNPNFGVFGKALVGAGGDRVFDWGVAAGVRFNF